MDFSQPIRLPVPNPFLPAAATAAVLLHCFLCLHAAGAEAPATPPAAATAARPWGIAGSSSSGKDFREWFPRMSEAGVETIRLFPEWPGVEPAEGKWTFDRSDALVQTAADNH